MAAAKGLQAPKKLSPELAAIVGTDTMSRPAVTKAIWDHIKANNLQDATDRRIINPDAKLAPVLGNEPIHMMKLAKALSPHFVGDAEAAAADSMPMAA